MVADRHTNDPSAATYPAHLVAGNPMPQRAKIIVDAIQAFSTSQSADDIIQLATRLARKGAEADGISFVLRDRDHCHYVNEDAIGPLWKGQRFPLSACVSGWSMQYRLAAIIPDIQEDSRVPQSAYADTFVRSMVMVPIRGSEPIGAIGAYWKDPITPSPETVHWLQALADAVSVGLRAVRAREEIVDLERRSPQPIRADNVVRMCAWTRRFWHNKEWLSVEGFLSARFGVSVSHGISPEARARFIEEFKEKPPP